jgi:hypothetical protein
MAVPRIRLSAIKPAPEPVIVPIVNTPAPETPESSAPAPQALAVPVPVPEAESAATVSLAVAVPQTVAAVPPLAFAPAQTDIASGGGNATEVVPQVAVVAAPAGSPAALTDEPASEAILKHSSAPALIRSSSMVFKWSVIAAMLLGVAFLAIRFLVPFFTELKKPKSAVVVVDKEASFAVKALQQTRQVAAKSDANVAYLHEVVATIEPRPAEVKAAAPSAASMPPAASAAASAGRGSMPDLSRFQEAIARLKVESVVTGAVARAMIDGRFVKQGDIIDRNLGLRFTGVDPDEHVLLFTNADNVVFKKHY